MQLVALKVGHFAVLTLALSARSGLRLPEQTMRRKRQKRPAEGLV